MSVTALPPKHHPDHSEEVRKWLLSLLPGSVYSHQVLHRHNGVLLHLAEGYISGAIEGLRATYATARVQLGEDHAPETIAAALNVVADLGAELAEQLELIRSLREPID